MYCEKCFKLITEGKGHAEWCPYFKDTVDFLKDMFGM